MCAYMYVPGIRVNVCVHIYLYGVATVSRIDKIIGLFGKRDL